MLPYAECDSLPSWTNSGQAAHEYIKCFVAATVAGTTLLRLHKSISCESTAPFGLYLHCSWKEHWMKHLVPYLIRVSLLWREQEYMGIDTGSSFTDLTWHDGGGGDDDDKRHLLLKFAAGILGEKME